LVVLAFLYLKKSDQISAQEALALANKGALVIDVRSPAEFGAGHLPGVINIPLDAITSTLPSRVPDKNQAILLHCASGTRSGIAVRKLKALGYGNAFNLGSYGKAEAVLNGRQ
jgi:phage shock protein E